MVRLNMHEKFMKNTFIIIRKSNHGLNMPNSKRNMEKRVMSEQYTKDP